MAHSPFGWSYPPGCSGPPEDGRDPSPEEEAIQMELEGFLPEPNIDRVMKIVAGLVDQACAECPRCEEAALKAEVEAAELWKARQ